MNSSKHHTGARDGSKGTGPRLLWLIRRQTPWATAIAAAVAALLSTLVLLAGCATSIGASSTLADQHKSASAQPWQVYHDSYGYFTVQLPPGWTATAREGGTATVGNHATGQSATYPVYQTILRDSAPDAAEFTITIVASPLVNSFMQQRDCGLPGNAALAGNAVARSGQRWTFASERAQYDISFAIGGPRVSTYVQGQATTTPVPFATIQADVDLYHHIVATFTPVPNTPLVCK